MSTLPFPRLEPVDFFTIELMLWWIKAAPVAMDMLLNPKYRRATFGSTLSGNLLIYPLKNLIMETDMNGRKSKDNGAKHSLPANKSLPFGWVNCPLTSEDYDYLEQQTASLELLTSNLIQLVVRGFGVSVKYDHARKSFNVCIYRPDIGDGRQPLGLSGHSTDVRDAILVTLYRFDHKLGGEFPDRIMEGTSNQPSRRFG